MKRLNPFYLMTGLVGLFCYYTMFSTYIRKVGQYEGSSQPITDNMPRSLMNVSEAGSYNKLGHTGVTYLGRVSGGCEAHLAVEQVTGEPGPVITLFTPRLTLCFNLLGDVLNFLSSRVISEYQHKYNQLAIHTERVIGKVHGHFSVEDLHIAGSILHYLSEQNSDFLSLEHADVGRGAEKGVRDLVKKLAAYLLDDGQRCHPPIEVMGDEKDGRNVNFDALFAERKAGSAQHLLSVYCSLTLLNMQLLESFVITSIITSYSFCQVGRACSHENKEEISSGENCCP